MAGKVKLNRFAEGINVGSPTANDIVTSSFEVYATDAAYVTANGTAAAGDAYYNSGDNLFHIYDGTNWETCASKFPSYTSAANYETQNGTAANGDQYYDSTLNKVRAYENGAWQNLTDVPSKVVATKTGAYTLTTSDDVIIADASGGGFTLTLPAVSGNAGLVYRIIKSDTSDNKVTLDGSGAETINNQTTIDLMMVNDSIEITCDGSEWFITAGRLFFDSTKITWAHNLSALADDGTDNPGDFNTFTIAGSGNTKTLETSTAPTQTVASMKADGIRLLRRNGWTSSTNATSPAHCKVMLYPNLSNIQIRMFNSTGQSGVRFSVNTQYIYSGDAIQTGLAWSYKRDTGVIEMSVGAIIAGSSTTAYRIQDDIGGTYTNPYIIITGVREF